MYFADFYISFSYPPVFGVDGHTQHSFTKLNMILKSVGSGSVASPSNAQTYDDLKFEFENDVKEDEDLKAPKPFFFHHKGQDLDSAGQNRAADQVHISTRFTVKL